MKSSAEIAIEQEFNALAKKNKNVFSESLEIFQVLLTGVAQNFDQSTFTAIILQLNSLRLGSHTFYRKISIWAANSNQEELGIAIIGQFKKIYAKYPGVGLYAINKDRAQLSLLMSKHLEGIVERCQGPLDHDFSRHNK